MRNGSTSAPPDVRPLLLLLPLLLPPPPPLLAAFPAEVLDVDPAGGDVEQEEEEEEETREEDRKEGASSCLHLFTRWRTPSLIACPSWPGRGGGVVSDGTK